MTHAFPPPGLRSLRKAALFCVLIAAVPRSPVRAEDAPGAEELDRNVEQLADREPATRDAAEAMLAKAGGAAEARLRAALDGEVGRDADGNARIKRLLGKIGDRRRSAKLAEKWGVRWFMVRTGEKAIGVLRLETRVEADEIVCDDTIEYFGSDASRIVTRLAADGSMAFKSFEVGSEGEKEPKVTKFDPKTHGADAIPGGFAELRFVSALHAKAGFERTSPLLSPWDPSAKFSETVKCVGERDGAVDFHTIAQGESFTSSMDFTVDPDGVLLSYKQAPEAKGVEPDVATPCTEEEAAAARKAAAK